MVDIKIIFDQQEIKDIKYEETIYGTSYFITFNSQLRASEYFSLLEGQKSQIIHLILNSKFYEIIYLENIYMDNNTIILHIRKAD